MKISNYYLNAQEMPDVYFCMNEDWAIDPKDLPKLKDLNEKGKKEEDHVFTSKKVCVARGRSVVSGVVHVMNCLFIRFDACITKAATHS